MRKILMLDFDGVLHPAQGSHVPDFAFAPRLATCLKGTCCEVVISSTWRDHHPLPRLRAFLPEPIASRVVGVLPEDWHGPHVRFRTIQAWLASNAPHADWRALDDTASEFPPACAELIHCDGRLGLMPPQISRLEEWLAA